MPTMSHIECSALPYNITSGLVNFQMVFYCSH